LVLNLLAKQWSVQMLTKSLPNQVVDAVEQMKDKVNDISRSATEKIAATRTAAAGSLDLTASALHDGAEKVADVAHTTADKLSASAKYLRNHDAKGILADVRRMVKNNPGISLLVAGIVGYSVARAVRSRE